MLFYSIGEALQERAVERARRNIRALVDIRPEQAKRFGGRETGGYARCAGSCRAGRIEVLPGGRVPLDGVLLSEAAPFNTAALTGESTPRTIRKGEEVLAGMISSLQPVRIEVTRRMGRAPFRGFSPWSKKLRRARLPPNCSSAVSPGFILP